MEILIKIIIWGLSIIFAYFIFKRFITLPANWFHVIRFYLILAPFALAFLGFAYYYIYKGQSESFKKGLALLTSDNKILSAIGGYKSYSFFRDSLPNENDNPAKFKITLNGGDARIYLRVTMVKDKFGNWTLKELKEDSLVKNQ